MLADDFAQPTPDAVTDNRGADRARGNKSRTKRIRIAAQKNAKRDQPAPLHLPVFSYGLKFPALRQSSALWKYQRSRQHGDCRSYRYSKSLSFAAANERLRKCSKFLFTETEMY